MDLIRLLLQKTEGEEPAPDLSGYTVEQQLCHYVLMEEAGLIVAHFSKGMEGEVVGAIVDRLTNAGHDFLEASRSDTIWNKFKQSVEKVGGSISIPVAIELLKGLVRTQIGL
jgi:hypothetical protein